MTTLIRRRRGAAWYAGAAAVGLSLCGSAAAEAQGKLFQWKDANGVLHFSNSAPPQGDAEVTVSTMENDFRPVPLEVGDGQSHKIVQVAFKGPKGAAKVPMIVDTGAQVTMIDEELATDLGARWISDEMLAGVGGVTRGWRGEITSLRIGNAELKDVEIIVGPMPGLRLLGIDVLNQLHLSVGQNTLYRGGR
jgi:predicted aspartyl protease